MNLNVYDLPGIWRFMLGYVECKPRMKRTDERVIVRKGRRERLERIEVWTTYLVRMYRETVRWMRRKSQR